MFGPIVPRYDLLTRLMSLRMDRRWRRLVAAGVVALHSGRKPRDCRFVTFGPCNSPGGAVA